jgi:hypothetical protein
MGEMKEMLEVGGGEEGGVVELQKRECIDFRGLSSTQSTSSIVSISVASRQLASPQLIRCLS